MQSPHGAEREPVLNPNACTHRIGFGRIGFSRILLAAKGVMLYNENALQRMSYGGFCPMKDRLYELAFAFRKEKLWNHLWESDYFAMRLPDGTTGYLAVVGKETENPGLYLYRGEEDFAHFVCEFENYESTEETDLLQNSLEVLFLDKGAISLLHQLQDVTAYLARSKKRASGKNAYPFFAKNKPYQHVTQNPDNEEQDLLCEALEAALALCKQVKETSPVQLGFSGENGPLPDTVPLLEKKDGQYSITGQAAFPSLADYPYHSGGTVSEDLVCQLKKFRKIADCNAGSSILLCPAVTKMKKKRAFIRFV